MKENDVKPELILRDNFGPRFHLSPEDIRKNVKDQLQEAMDKACREAGLDPKDPNLAKKAEKLFEDLEDSDEARLMRKFDLALSGIEEDFPIKNPTLKAAVEAAKDLLIVQIRAARKASRRLFKKGWWLKGPRKPLC